MKKEIIQREEIIYKFSEKEYKKILKRILNNHKDRLIIYWDYNDSLREEQILKIIKEEDGLLDVENDFFDCNTEWMYNTIEEILTEELNQKEKTDKDLKDYLRQELESNFNINIKGLIKNSEIRLRCELETNEDFLYLPDYKNTEYYKLIKEVFKGGFSIKDLKEDINSFIGSDYAKLTFFFKVKGEDILRLREEIQKGKITFFKGCGCGFFNSWMGCGSYLDLNLKKDITLNINNWTDKKENSKYYDISILEDNSNKYGIQEVYNLTSECWKEY